MVVYVYDGLGQESAAFVQFSRGSLTPERLGITALEALLAPASTSSVSSGCGLHGAGPGNGLRGPRQAQGVHGRDGPALGEGEGRCQSSQRSRRQWGRLKERPKAGDFEAE